MVLASTMVLASALTSKMVLASMPASVLASVLPYAQPEVSA